MAPSAERIPKLGCALTKVNVDAAAGGEPLGTYEQAAKIFEEMSLTKNFEEFLTLPLYEAMA